ncbi:hypothetical protein EJB05_27421, partial [Eragrostis curvula]
MFVLARFNDKYTFELYSVEINMFVWHYKGDGDGIELDFSDMEKETKQARAMHAVPLELEIYRVVNRVVMK